MMSWIKVGEELSELIKMKSAVNIKKTSHVSSERISNEENCEIVSYWKKVLSKRRN